MELDALIAQYSETHLICDSAHPLLTNSTIEDELRLYNLSRASSELLLHHFHLITGKEVNPSSDTTHLSGGQKVILLVLAALLSLAPRILFYNIPASLDPERAEQVRKLIEQYRSQKTEILELNDYVLAT